MSLFRLSFIVLGLGAFASAMYAKAESDATTWWSVTQGVITVSQVERVKPGVPHSKPTYYANIQYRYNIGGIEYQGDLKQLGADAIPAAKYAADLVNQYPKGTTVTIYYDPNQPQASALKRGVPASVIWMLVFAGAFFIFFGLFFRKGVLYMTEFLNEHWRSKRYKNVR